MKINRMILLGVLLLGLHLSSSAQKKTKDMVTLKEKARLSCKLTAPELQQRKETVVAKLKSQVLEKVETDQGYKYKFEGSDQMLDLLTSFIKTERLCCTFFDFRLTASSDAKFAWLELSGPEGTKDFIQHEIDF